MVRKEKKNTLVLHTNPYMYYVTNWGFVDQPTKNKVKTKTKKESLATR